MASVYEYSYTRKKIAEFDGQISSPADALPILQKELENVEQEHLVVLAMNTKNRVIGSETVYIGNTTGSPVRVGEVFRFAIRENAVTIIVAHNHPSGDPEPSADDRLITEEIIKAGKILDITVLDHLIIGSDGNYCSMRHQMPYEFQQ